jgi:hypothetical protein
LCSRSIALSSVGQATSLISLRFLHRFHQFLIASAS